MHPAYIEGESQKRELVGFAQALEQPYSGPAFPVSWVGLSGSHTQSTPETGTSQAVGLKGHGTITCFSPPGAGEDLGN